MMTGDIFEFKFVVFSPTWNCGDLSEISPLLKTIYSLTVVNTASLYQLLTCGVMLSVCKSREWCRTRLATCSGKLEILSDQWLKPNAIHFSRIRLLPLRYVYVCLMEGLSVSLKSICANDPVSHQTH